MYSPIVNKTTIASPLKRPRMLPRMPNLLQKPLIGCKVCRTIRVTMGNSLLKLKNWRAKKNRKRMKALGIGQRLTIHQNRDKMILSMQKLN